MKWEDTVEPFHEYLNDNNVFVQSKKVHTLDKKECNKIKKFIKHINDKNNV